MSERITPPGDGVGSARALATGVADPRLMSEAMRNTLSCFGGLSPWEPYMLALPNVRAAIEVGYLLVGPEETHVIGTKVCRARIVTRSPEGNAALAADREARRPPPEPPKPSWWRRLARALATRPVHEPEEL